MQMQLFCLPALTYACQDDIEIMPAVACFLIVAAWDCMLHSVDSHLLRILGLIQSRKVSCFPSFFFSSLSWWLTAQADSIRNFALAAEKGTGYRVVFFTPYLSSSYLPGNGNYCKQFDEWSES